MSTSRPTRHAPDHPPGNDRARSTAAAARPFSAAVLLGLLMALALLIAAPRASALPDGFTDEIIANVKASELAWTPDGRMLVGTKEGVIRVYTGGALLATPALDLSAVECTNDERGLQGLAVHPNFAVTHFVYVYYIYNKFGIEGSPGDGCTNAEGGPAVNRLSRFVLDDDNTIDPASETVLYESQRVDAGIHNGGNVVFGKDGNLYVTTGDGGSSSTSQFAQDLDRLLGKVLRFTADGGIPADNPFAATGVRCNVGGVPPAGSGAGARCQEIYARGFRNPFRGALDPNAAGIRLFVNDVGAHTWEEVNDVMPEGNYGWPVREGPCGRDLDTGPTCDAPPPGMTNPLFAYHQQPPDGGAITGGAFVPSGVWPAEYDGAYLYAEYVFGKINRLVPQAGGGYSAVEFTSATLVTTLRFGPTDSGGTALYYTSRDNGGEIHRVTASGSANRRPTAIAKATPKNGPLPLTVQFDGTESSDPDGTALVYAWDFGDGSPLAVGALQTHTYTSVATVNATLFVSDGELTSTSTVRLDPGRIAPVPTIDTPLETDRFAVGDRFTLRGHATDFEDGNLPDSALTWEVIRHHSSHTHPFLEPVAGNGIPIVGPEPEDLDAARTSYLEIRLTATDSNGLTTTVTRNLQPKLVPLTFATIPPGLALSAGNVVVTGPTTLPSWEKFAFPVEAKNQTVSGIPYTFGNWSDGGAPAHTIVTPAAATTFTVSFAGPVPPPPPGPPTTLRITQLRAVPRSFYARTRVSCRRSAPGGPVRCRPLPTRIGTSLRFTLSGPARVTITVIRPARQVCTGRGVARRCRTIRASTTGQISAGTQDAGSNVRIPGRLRNRILAPGPYELRVRARTATAQSPLLRLRVIVLRSR